MADFLYTYWLAQGRIILVSFLILGGVTALCGLVGTLMTLDAPRRSGFVASLLSWIAVLLTGLMILSVPVFVPSPGNWRDAVASRDAIVTTETPNENHP